MLTDWNRRVTTRVMGMIAVLVVSQLVALGTMAGDPLIYLWYAVSVLLLVLGYARGRTFGLVASVVAVFAMGSYDVLQLFVLHSIATASPINAVWFVLLPVSGYVAGELGDTLRAITETVEQQEGTNAQIALMDPDTGWMNRQAFFTFLGMEFLRNQRRFQRRMAPEAEEADWIAGRTEGLAAAEHTSIVLLQIRHYEDLAMIYGRGPQQTLLTWCMEQLNAVSRRTDFRAQLAPGLLAVILSETDVPGSATVVARLRETIRDYRWTPDNAGGRRIQLDIRCGAATSPIDGITPDGALDRALERLRRDLG